MNPKKLIAAAVLAAATATGTAACSSTETATTTAPSSSVSTPRGIDPNRIFGGMDKLRGNTQGEAAYVWTSEPCGGVVLRTPDKTLFSLNWIPWDWTNPASLTGFLARPVNAAQYRGSDCYFGEPDGPSSEVTNPGATSPSRPFEVHTIPYTWHVSDAGHAAGMAYVWLHVPVGGGEPQLLLSAGENYSVWAVPLTWVMCGEVPAGGAIAPRSARLDDPLGRGTLPVETASIQCRG